MTKMPPVPATKSVFIKTYGCQMNVYDSERMAEAMGGAGYTKEWPVERLARDAKLYDIGAGTNEIRRFLIGRELMKG